jgi:membrane protein
MFEKIGKKADDLRRRLRARLERIWAFRLAERTFLELTEHQATVSAAAIAYYVILSLFPLLLGLVSVLGFFLPYASVRQEVSDTLKQVLPGSSELVQQTLDNVVAMRGTAGITSLLLLLWSGSGLFGAIGRAIDRAWNVRTRRHFVILKLRDFAMIVGAGVLFLFSTSLSTVAHFFDRLARAASFWVLAVGGRAVGFVLTFALFMLIYKFMPNTRTYWRWTWPGGLVVTAFFQGGTYVFVFYLANFANYQSVYGSLGSVIVLLLWIYLSAIVVIFGAELNSELQRMSLGVGRGGV